MQITIIGTGFVGLVSAAVYASLGHEVIGLDIDQKKINNLRKSITPFYEPGLNKLLKQQLKKQNLSFTSNYKKAISKADLIIIAVGTPSAPDEQADLTYIFKSAESLAPLIREGVIIAIKSTVPPGTLKRIASIIKKFTDKIFFTASLPEFLREGSAVHDTLHPDRIVIGADEKQVFKKLKKLHLPLCKNILLVKPNSAQMGKYASNTYLATRITFINEIANLCEKNEADIAEVIKIISNDKRIGKHYWYPGIGYGGSCFPKDVKELAAFSRAVGEANNLFNKINDLNKNRVYKLLNRLATKVNGFENKTIAILGLSFKPNTDDIRESPASKIIPFLINAKAKIKVYDPLAKWPEKSLQQTSIKETCKKADIIMALIEWPEITSFDFSLVRANNKIQWFFDARNQFNKNKFEKLGYKYTAIGK
jgi:UDPglucose 6-dehydrogenase